MSVNRPLFVPAGVVLRPMQPDEQEATTTSAVITCEGPCRPSWTPHYRGATPIAAGELVSAHEHHARSSPRFICEYCQTSRRWGS